MTNCGARDFSPCHAFRPLIRSFRDGSPPRSLQACTIFTSIRKTDLNDATRLIDETRQSSIEQILPRLGRDPLIVRQYVYVCLRLIGEAWSRYYCRIQTVAFSPIYSLSLFRQHEQSARRLTNDIFLARDAKHSPRRQSIRGCIMRFYCEDG